MKKVLKELIEKKGVLSRQIGEAKRAGESIDSLLAEMKSISEHIKLAKTETTATTNS